MYLCIKNPGVAPIEGYLLLGVSTTRDCGVAGTIGQFGSGSKHAINILLRAGLKLVIQCGRTKLEFKTRPEVIDDGLVKKPVDRVVCQISGTQNKTIDTGWVLDFGTLDWQDISMALREFVANALDRTIREEGGFIPAIQDGRLSITTKDKPRANAGFTQVFIEMNEDVLRFFGELPRRFLHFSARPELIHETILQKAGRDFSNNSAMIYREGVFVREMRECNPSLYDYNLSADSLVIDESRNSSPYSIKATCGAVLKYAPTDALIVFLQSLIRHESTFESGIDADYICPAYSWAVPNELEKANWQAAWQAVAGNSILCGPSEMEMDFIRRKGKPFVSIKSQAFVEMLSRFGIPTSLTVLSTAEKAGKEKMAPTSAASEAVDEVWQWIDDLGLTKGKSKPVVGCFRSLMENNERALGFCDPTGVYFADDHASNRNEMLLQTVLEELTHWITGSDDGSRDFQEFLLRIIVSLKLQESYV